ncbi:glycosyltransferase [Terriglobus saanensis]|uniref:Glycosyl transferase family 2 n=1 Tax=Terriglobus saanensis (strain ATCC BAA-1853 / DSM 23119 / SP1PR4) TaxID=401053 RepID=E8UWW6_TERSS|nr:glycosyltransferase [Terriglobus saanensis]ADV81853.1 glycosyl transferase family 2 [Terriglobus saanensis SP1PR4]
MKVAVEIIAWLIALSWWSRVLPAILYTPRLPDLLKTPKESHSASSITIIVPARNEAAAIGQTLRSLATQDHALLRVIAINDRSTDATGSIMNQVAAEYPAVIQVLHLSELPSQWTGKVHAMALAARSVETDWMLFTDGDVNFAPSAIRLALATAEGERVDHFVLLPTMEIHTRGEGIVLGFFQIVSIWAVRLWKVKDVHAKRDIVGVGAFNLIRREAYEKIGGFDAMPMEILEDMRLASTVKRAGLRSQVGFGRDFIRIHWAEGMRGIVGVLTKNMFAGALFRVELVLAICLWLTAFCVLPFFGLFVHATRWQAVVTLLAMVATYMLYAKQSRIPVWYVLAAPFAAVVMIYAVLRSMLFALRQRGVTWRGTFYPLADLRRRARSIE